MNTVWMIRNDGSIFPCTQHFYANAENMEETLAAAEWLYTNTHHQESRQLALETVAAWMASVPVNGNVPSNVLNMNYPNTYITNLQAFVTEHWAEIQAIPTEKLNLTTLLGEVSAELNQEFLRARYGGMYSKDTSSREVLLYISSVGFDWYKIICSFISLADFPIEMVTIVWGEEITQAEQPLSLQLPTEKFLSEKPIRLELPQKLKGGVMTREIFAHLSGGSSLRHISWDLVISTSELANLLQSFRSA